MAREYGPHPTTSETMAHFDDLKSGLTFDILRNAIYHTARHAFLDRINRFIVFLVIGFGTSAAAQFGQHFGLDDKWLAAAAAFVATLQLVADFGVSASLHAYLQKRCYELLSELEIVPDGETDDVLKLRSRLTLIYGDEPPQMRALDAIAFNAASDSLGRKITLKILWWQSLARHFYPFNGTSFEEVRPSQT
jgi:hypothetical protein